MPAVYLGGGSRSPAKEVSHETGWDEAGSLHVPMWNLTENFGGQYEVWWHQAFSHQLPWAIG